LKQPQQLKYLLVTSKTIARWRNDYSNEPEAVIITEISTGVGSSWVQRVVFAEKDAAVKSTNKSKCIIWYLI
jgi:hypothetical protein